MRAFRFELRVGRVMPIVPSLKLGLTLPRVCGRRTTPLQKPERPSACLSNKQIFSTQAGNAIRKHLLFWALQLKLDIRTCKIGWYTGT